MSDHHPTLPPSSFDAIKECALYASGPAGEAADRGTLQHAYLHALNAGIEPPAEDLTDEELEQVMWAHEYMSKFTGLQSEVEVVVFSEADRFTEITFGTLDGGAIVNGMGVVLDYKSGERRSYQGQLAAYALGWMQLNDLQVCTTHLLFGKTRDVEDGVISRADAWKMVSEVYARRIDPNRSPTPCDYCGWCANKETCPALNATALAVVKGYSVPEFKTWHPSEISDPATMAAMLTAARIVEPWVDSVKSHAKEMARTQKLPGYLLKEKRGRRTIENLNAAFEKTGLTQDEFLSACTASFTKIVELLQTKTQKSKGACEKALEAMLADCLSREASIVYLEKEKEA